MSQKITRIFQIDQKIRQENPKCLVAGKENNQWKKYSGKEFSEITDHLAYGLITLGLKSKDVISVISSNRPEWIFADFAAVKATMVDAAIYPNITTEDYEYILNDCQSKVVFVENQEIYDKVKPGLEHLKQIVEVYSFDHVEGVKHWTELLELGKENPQSSYIKAWQVETKADDIFTIIYTSGTTGKPKGVLLDHTSFLFQIEGVKKYFPIYKGENSLSFLPLSHIFQRVVDYYVLYSLSSVYFAEAMDTIGENLKEVKPVIFSTVPRLLEKVYDKIVLKGSELTGIKKALFFWALNLGKAYEFEGKSAWYKWQLKLANKIIFSKWRAALGDEVRYVIVGASALQPRLARVFSAAQIPVFEGYGLSETAPIISFNSTQRGNQFGYVGKVIEGGAVKIAEDGEILYKGPNLMKGYLNRPDATEEAIKDGWFHTGDIGQLEDDGFLKITDRKKEMFKTSGGKYIAPQVLENKMKESRFIEQLMVIGDGEKFPAALIQPSQDFIYGWCERKEIAEKDWAKLMAMPRIQERIWKEVDVLNENFANYMRIKKVLLVSDIWKVENKLLTPTQKLKRRNIYQKYQREIKDIYDI
ncbi:MAG: long-chain fatty acid--CoA ligase [Flavobacteriales bacterium]|jgi:long-chain acyl-CoA synthetase|nr:long-chain fatty acid--CoA ligase [Flavobacteriales bacterium]